MGLNEYDYCLLIDRSGSMMETDCPGGKSRWAYTKEQAIAFAGKCEEFDSDGTDLFLYSTGVKHEPNCTAVRVKEIFDTKEPNGSTNTAAALQAAFDLHFQKFTADGSKKPTIIVCLTDGEPDDKKAVSDVIVEATKKMNDDGELGITFIQVGYNEEARKYLEFLDNNLRENSGAKFDIVDTKSFKEIADNDLNISDVLLAAIND